MMRSTLTIVAVLALASSAQATRLDTMVTYAAGSNPRGLAVGDLNGDGKADVAVANFGAATLIGQATTQAAGTLQLFKGTVDGLVPWTLLPSGKSPRGLAMADLNADGRQDIVASFYDDNSVGVYLQKADGSYGQPATVAVGSHPVGVAVGKLQQKVVFAVANYNSDSVSLLRMVDSVPVLVSTLAVGAAPTDLKFYQPKGAKDPMLLVAAYGANQMTRLTLKADGTQASRVDSIVSGQPCKIVVADINGDGRLDAAVAQFTESRVTFFAGLEDGSLDLTGTATVLRGSHPNGIAYGALGGTGRLVTADRDSDQADLLEWTPQGLTSTATLAVPDGNGNTAAAFGPVEVAVADVNGDSLADLVMTDMRSGELKLFAQRLTAEDAIGIARVGDDSAKARNLASWLPADKDLISAPNPAHGSTEAVFRLRHGGSATLSLVNLAGEVVLRRRENDLPEGVSALVLELQGLASGVYYLVLEGEGDFGPGVLARFKLAIVK
jgi:hypothetical protein